MVINPIRNTDLTQFDLDFIRDILCDYLEDFDEERELMTGESNPAARQAYAESLFSRLVGVDLSGSVPPVHHSDCDCPWCQSGCAPL